MCTDTNLELICLCQCRNFIHQMTIINAVLHEFELMHYLTFLITMNCIDFELMINCKYIHNHPFESAVTVSDIRPLFPFSFWYMNTSAQKPITNCSYWQRCMDSIFLSAKTAVDCWFHRQIITKHLKTCRFISDIFKYYSVTTLLSNLIYDIFGLFFIHIRV